MTKVSVIVPVYKVEAYLDNCVNSLLRQTLDDIEIILVDDGSPDNCPAICDGYAEKDSRIKVIHKKNNGVSAARNDGLSRATGEYVIFCDSDDWMEINGLEALYKKAKECDADIVIGDVYLAKNSEYKHVQFYRAEFDTEDRAFISEMIKCDIYRTYCPEPSNDGPAFGYGGPWNKLVRRDLLSKNSITFDLRTKGIFDDILYTAYILAAAVKISYIHAPVYYYRILDGSMTHSFKPNVVAINEAIFNSWQEFFEKQPEKGIYQEAYYACVMRRLEEAVKLYFINEKNKKTKKELKRELKGLVSRKPYYEAARKVDLGKISKKQKLLACLARTGLIGIIYNVPVFGNGGY